MRRRDRRVDARVGGSSPRAALTAIATRANRAAIAILAPTATLAVTAPAAAAQTADRLAYPETQVVDVVDDFHGTAVADPYRWLEDTDAPETRRWIEAQNRVTFGYLERLPARERLRERLTELWDYPRYGVPSFEGGVYIWRKNDGLQNQPVLYAQASLEEEPRPLIDPNRFSEDGTIALTSTEASPNGRYLAYGTSSGGSDWQEFRVREIATGEDLDDHLRWIKFSGMTWTKDETGFFYARYPRPEGRDTLLAENRNHQLFYHRVGTPQSEDRLVYERPDEPEWGFGAEVTDDGRFLVLHVWHGTDPKNRIYYADLGDPEAPRLEGLEGRIAPLLDEFDASYDFIGNVGEIFYFLTDNDAPRGRVIAVDLDHPGADRWMTIVPEREDALQSAHLVGGRLALRYLRDARSRVEFRSLEGEPLGTLELPTLGTVSGLSGEPDRDELFFAFTSFLHPTTVFRHDLRTGRSEVLFEPGVELDPEAYETRQVFYRSKDGTRVPMFLTHRKGMERDGSHPVLLYAYGGFNIPVTPGFSVVNLAWLEEGGVYAVANLRGGGEYGREWHDAGRLKNKQNVFDDFIAAAEWLVAEGYTRPERIAIAGGSNGGLLVGAAMTQRPDLFGVALPAVGVMDMLRFHRFTIGWAWTSDYGSAEDPEMFPVLHAYSPYHNLRDGVCYPATLVTTADHDDRVVPGHSFKFTARLQAAHACDRPVLIRIETRAGHGAGKPTEMQIEEAADRLAFALANLGLNESAAPAGDERAQRSSRGTNP